MKKKFFYAVIVAGVVITANHYFTAGIENHEAYIAWKELED